jgi:hypothetical protein
VRAVGSDIAVFLNGQKVINVVDSDLATERLFRLFTYDVVVGTAQADFQYLAIHPL